MTTTKRDLTDAASEGVFGGGWFGRFITRYGTLCGIVIILAIFSALSPSFRTFANGRNILLQSMPLLMVSLAMTTALILRGVDLSVAYVADLAALVAAMALGSVFGPFGSIACGLLAGIGIGVLNGGLIVIGVPALVATLGMMFIIKSVQLMTSGGGQPILVMMMPPAKTKPFLWLGQGTVGAVPTQVIFGVLVLVLMYFVVYRMRSGRYFHAIGGNVKAAFLSGVGTKGYFTLGYILSGLLAACAGIMNVTRTGIAQPEGSSYLLLDSFVASYIGSITFHKGRMNILGTAVGVLFVSILTNGVTVLGLGIVYQYIFKGCLIFIAVAAARFGTARE